LSLVKAWEENRHGIYLDGEEKMARTVKERLSYTPRPDLKVL
jgi:hypothetical protein